MKFLDLTLPTPEENLACDEVLLDLLEEGAGEETLRLWESPLHFVVLGISGRAQEEVDLGACRRLEIPVLRRVSGGGTVLQGPGCLNYSLCLKIKPGPLKNLRETTAWIMERHKKAVAEVLGKAVQVQGTSDLTLGPLKFSGNAQRRKRISLLFHGTFLHRFDTGLTEKILQMPKKRPPYRKDRSHQDFMMNLNIDPRKIRKVLRDTWNAWETSGHIPLERIQELSREKYSDKAWTHKF